MPVDQDLAGRLGEAERQHVRVDRLGMGDVNCSLAALDARLEAIAQRAPALLRAGALLAEIIEAR
ncbi:hypothetical protein [Saccharopolyspora karakumensis]|uniref:hypothetical protein n=1 Tax=Saccharopolyspora karakumensis TaxID=2530386 RepID=UPI001A9DB9CA|nr:hypothetical protein [Saccharopolyspora karakumensis]